LQPFGDHCRRLVATLKELRSPLLEEVDKALDAVIEEGARDPEGAAVKIQKLLDRYCLIGVTINPESRVKATRGPAAAELRQGRPAFVLVKVQNEAGVSHPLKVSGPQLRAAGQADGGRWLEAVVPSGRGVGPKLRGHKVEYLILRLTAQEAGKREATLKFDVGQGTQDLGFRAEVPVLFTVRGPEK
jgi:hypothetical protein